MNICELKSYIDNNFSDNDRVETFIIKLIRDFKSFQPFILAYIAHLKEQRSLNRYII